MKTCGAFRTEVDSSFDTHLRNVEIRLEAVLRAADDAREGLESRRSGPPLQAPGRTANREEKGTERPPRPAAATPGGSLAGRGGRETVAGKWPGCMTQFAVDVRLPLPATCPDCGADVLTLADIEGPPRRPFNALRIRTRSWYSRRNSSQRRVEQETGREHALSGMLP